MCLSGRKQMLGDKKTWCCLGRIVVGCGLLLPRLGFSCEMDSDEINFIIWTEQGKNSTGIKCFAILGLICCLYNVLVAGVRGNCKKEVKCPSYLGRKFGISCLFNPSGILCSEELSCVRLWLFYLRQLFFPFLWKNICKIQTNLKHQDVESCWVFGCLFWTQWKVMTYLTHSHNVSDYTKNLPCLLFWFCFTDLMRCFQLEVDWGMCICEQVIPWRIAYYL